MRYMRLLIPAIFLFSCGLAAAQDAPPAPTAPPAVAAPEAPPSPKAQLAFAFNIDGGGYLGVETADVTNENASRLDLGEPRGVVIEQVIGDSPAARAGLQKDDVILKFEGEEVTSVRKLTRLIGEVAPDHKVKLRISRGGHEQDLSVTLGQRQGPMAWSGKFEDFGKYSTELGKLNTENWTKLQDSLGKLQIEALAGGKNFIWELGGGRHVGISTVGLTKQLAEYFGVPSGQGVLVTNVNPDSPAAKSGLKAGDVITEIDSEKVNDAGDVARSINHKTDGDVTFTVIRDRGQRMFTVTPEKGAAGYNIQNGTFVSPTVLVQPKGGPATPFRLMAPGRTVPVGVRPARRTSVIL